MGLLETIDFHVHTNRSVCCQQSQTLKTLVEEYMKRGYEHIAVCDHYYPGKIDLFKSAREEVDKIREETGLDLRLSAEIEILDASGELDCPEFDNLVKLLDHISAAPHTKKLVKAVPPGADPIEFIHEAHLAAARNPLIDVILHPWDGAEALVPGLYALPDAFLKTFAQTASNNGKIVEISNCMNHYWIRPAEFTNSYHLLVKELIDEDVKLVVGSDGHNLTPDPGMSHLSVAATTGDTSWAVRVIREMGGSDSNVGLPIQKSV